MLIFGAGGHSKVIIDAALASGINIEGVFDDYSDKPILGIPNLGAYDSQTYQQEKIIVGIGNNEHRKEIVMNRIKHSYYDSLIQRGSFISEHSQIGRGTVVFATSVVQTNSKIGKHVILNTGSQVDHDCTIGDFCHIAPAAVICGGVIIEEGAFIGAGATIIPGVRIGKWSKIGAGAVVINNISAHSVVAGVPAKPIRQM